jgi:hypothetical protein
MRDLILPAVLEVQRKGDIHELTRLVVMRLLGYWKIMNYTGRTMRLGELRDWLPWPL